MTRTHINLNIVLRISLLHANQRLALGHNQRRYANHSWDFRLLLMGQSGEGFEAGDSTVGVEDRDDGLGAIGDGVDDGLFDG